MCCSRLPLWLGYFIYFEFTRFSSILCQSLDQLKKQISAFFYLNIYLIFLNIWEKLRFSKLVGKINFSKRKFEEMHQLRKPKRYKVYSGKRLFWDYYIQLSFVLKSVSQISFKLFCSGEFLRKWSWFQGDDKRFLKYLA